MTAQLLPARCSSRWVRCRSPPLQLGCFRDRAAIVTTLSEAVGADMTVVIGATLSASTFGSHACFYTDAHGADRPVRRHHALPARDHPVPFALMAAFVSAVAYLVIAWF